MSNFQVLNPTDYLISHLAERLSRGFYIVATLPEDFRSIEKGYEFLLSKNGFRTEQEVISTTVEVNYVLQGTEHSTNVYVYSDQVGSMYDWLVVESYGHFSWGITK